jgi:PAS domain S-box-containing protein
MKNGIRMKIYGIKKQGEVKMKSANKSKKELIAELQALRERVFELERHARNSRQSMGSFRERTGRSYAQMAYMHEAIFVIFDRKFEFVNDRFTELFGVSSEEACSSNFDPMTLIAPESRRFIRELYREACHGAHTTKQFNYTGLSKDGLKIECETFLLFIPYKWGVAIQGTLRSTYMSMRTDEALQRRHSDLPSVSNVVPTGVPYAEKVRAQDLRDTKDDMPVWNLFQTFAQHSANATTHF